MLIVLFMCKWFCIYINVFRLMMIIFRGWLKSNMGAAESAEVQHAAITVKRRWRSLCDGWISMLFCKPSLKWPLIWMGHLVFSLLGSWLKFKEILTRLESWIYTVQTLGYRETGVFSTLSELWTFFHIRRSWNNVFSLKQQWIVCEDTFCCWIWIMQWMNYGLRFLGTFCCWHWGPCWPWNMTVFVFSSTPINRICLCFLILSSLRLSTVKGN